jgi:hypothetical protein
LSRDDGIVVDRGRTVIPCPIRFEGDGLKGAAS